MQPRRGSLPSIRLFNFNQPCGRRSGSLPLVFVKWKLQANRRVGALLGKRILPCAAAYHHRQCLLCDLQPVAGRIYYPAVAAASGGWLPSRWRGSSWLWDIHYAMGLGKFLFFRLPKSLLYSVLKRALVAFAWAAGKAQRMDMTPGAALALGAPQELPVVVFSHGLGGTRFM
jgi:hypothetical protein